MYGNFNFTPLQPQICPFTFPSTPSAQQIFSARIADGVCPYCLKRTILQNDVRYGPGWRCGICFHIFVLNPETNLFVEYTSPVLPKPVVFSPFKEELEKKEKEQKEDEQRRIEMGKEIANLKEENASLKRECADVKEKNADLKEENTTLRRECFGIVVVLEVDLNAKTIYFIIKGKLVGRVTGVPEGVYFGVCLLLLL
jgi:hypothetical protein